MPASPPSSPPVRPSRQPEPARMVRPCCSVRSTVLLLLTAALLLQVGGASTYLYSRIQDAPQQAQRQLELAAASTAHALSLWLAVPDDAAASLVLAPTSGTQALRATAHSGLNIPPPLWFSAAPAQPEQPAPQHNALSSIEPSIPKPSIAIPSIPKPSIAQPLLLSAPVTLEGAEYILVGRALPDGSTILHARPLSSSHGLHGLCGLRGLRGLLARAENSRVTGAVVLHTRTGDVLLYNNPPVDALRRALGQYAGTGAGAIQPTGTPDSHDSHDSHDSPDSPNSHAFAGTIAVAGGLALHPLNIQIAPLPSSTSPTTEKLTPHNSLDGTAPLGSAAHTPPAPTNPPLGYVGFIQPTAPSTLDQLGEVLRQSPLLWGWHSLCAILLGGLLWRMRALTGPRDANAPNTPNAPNAPSALTRSLQAQLKATTARLQSEAAQRRHLSGQCISLLENIRLDLGRELHDQIGQRLAALLLLLEARPPHTTAGISAGASSASLETSPDASSGTSPNASPELSPETSPAAILHQAIPHLRRIQKDIRHLARGLRPPALSGAGLGGLGVALRSLCDDYAQAGMAVHYFEADVPALDTERALALYRITQEALTNAAKHAKARNVFVSLVARGNTLTVTIEDDGQGFTPTADLPYNRSASGETALGANAQVESSAAYKTVLAKNARDETPAPAGVTASPHGNGGMGLLLMHERMAQWGGQLTIDSAAGHGCTVMAELPL